ncbi:MAG: ATP-binding protein [Burkholderiales bacterium]|nr:ATP-binding protein [Pseudomonadota bacterium]
MRFYYPKSFLKLIFIGFSLVVLPLFAALINNAITVDRLADKSQEAVYQAVQATHNSRTLIELIVTMERNARQFVILGDQTLFDAYLTVREKFRNTAAEFASLPFDLAQMSELDQIRQRERKIYATLTENRSEPEQLKRAVEAFVPLSNLAQALEARSRDLIDREVDAMQKIAVKARYIIFWQLLAMIPVALFLVIGFSILISRPIVQIDSAIRRLGDGEFGQQIVVNGPQDLEYLGKRLDWMRLRLIELEEQKSKFLRNVSHELKTPLTAVREGTELLSEGLVGKLSRQQREVVEILRHNGIALQRVIEGMLNYQAVQFQKSDLHWQPVRIKPLIEQVASEQMLTVRAKGIKLDIVCPEITLDGDPEKIKIVIANLLSNAVKFSPQRETIRIRARRHDSEIVLEVIDCGPGIAPDDKDKIFDAFYQGAAKQGGYVKGTGLGLSIVREYVMAHYGTIKLIDPITRGAHFRITLPANHAEPA